MVVSISATVGAYSANRPADLTAIQQLLNQVPPTAGGPVPLLVVDGLIGPKTKGAIAQFQMKQFGWADMRIDPGGQTLARLNSVTGQPGAPPPPPLPPRFPIPVRVKPPAGKPPRIPPPKPQPPTLAGGVVMRDPGLYLPEKDRPIPDRPASNARLTEVSGPVLVSGPALGTARGFSGMLLHPNETVRTGPFTFAEDPSLGSLLGAEGRAVIRYADGTSIAMAPRSMVVIFGSAGGVNVSKAPPPLVEIDEEAVKDALGALGGLMRK